MFNRRLFVKRSWGDVPDEMKGNLTIGSGNTGTQIWGFSDYHNIGDLNPHNFKYSGSPSSFNVTAVYVDEMYIGTVLLDCPLTPQPGSIKITLNGEISFTLAFRNNAENKSAYGGFTSNEVASWFVAHYQQIVNCKFEFI